MGSNTSKTTTPATPTTVATTTTTANTPTPLLITTAATTAATTSTTALLKRLTQSEVGIIVSSCCFLILSLSVIILSIWWRRKALHKGSKENQFGDGDIIQTDVIESEHTYANFDKPATKMEEDADITYTAITIGNASFKPSTAVVETEYATVKNVS